MSKPPTTPDDPQRIAAIAQAIRGACSPVLAADEAKADAADALQGAVKGATSLRESIMVTLADLSQRGQWTAGEIASGAAKAAAMSNNASEKALAVFIGETKRAMSPNVRSHVPALLALRDLTWADETELRKADKDAPTPLRKAFVRQYHMLTAMFGAAEDGRVITTAADVLEFAAERDPDHDPAKVLKRLETLTAALAGFYRDFPVDDIQVCVQTLNEITKKDLVQARARANPSAHDTHAAKVVPSVTVTKPDASKLAAALSPTVHPTVVVDNQDVATGASDILSDILGDDTHPAMELAEAA